MTDADVFPEIYDDLTQDERRILRGEYVRAQGGLCLYCGSALDGSPAEHVMSRVVDWRLFPDGFQRYPVHLHYSHDTGVTIGAVHMRCNAVLWQFHGE